MITTLETQGTSQISGNDDSRQYILTAQGLEPVIYNRFFRIPFPVIGRLMTMIHQQDEEGYRQYLEALGTVKRWKTGDQPVIPFAGESVLEHVAAGMHLIWLIKQGFHYLNRVVYANRVADYFFLHDGGEVGADDLANTDPRLTDSDQSQLDQVKKDKAQQERAAFIQLVVPMFKTSLQPLVLAAFLEYEDRNSLAALFAKWIDVIAGNRVALYYFYPKRTAISAERVRTIALFKFYTETQRVLEALQQRAVTSRGAREAVTEFLILAASHQTEFISHGYEVEVESYRGQFGSLFDLLESFT